VKTNFTKPSSNGTSALNAAGGESGANGAEPHRVLIVERDLQVRALQAHFLERQGFTVEFADDGDEALERVRVWMPQVLVTEILIPKVDGLTLCRRLREDTETAHIPVVVFSILSAATRAQEAGAKAFVRKPLIESVFLSTIEDVIAAHAATEQR
jgi:two-component system, cell cycle response regulator